MPTKLFQKGMKKYPGSGMKKGQKTKFTTLKAAFVGAFQKIGGEQALVEWLTESTCTKVKDKKTGKIKLVLNLSASDRKESFFKMLSSMLPKDVQLSGKDGEPLVAPPTLVILGPPKEESK